MATRAEPDLRCYYHPEREAAGQCDRCGDYLCAECAKQGHDQELCDRCLAYLDRPELPRGGKIACLTNVFAIFVYWPLLGVAMMAFRFEEKPVILWEAIGSLLAIFVFSTFKAFRAKRGHDDGADNLLSAIAVTSMGFSLLCMVELASFTYLLLTSQRPYDPPTLLAVAGYVSVCVLMILAAIRWVQAVRAGVTPLWPVILAAITTLMEMLFVGVLVWDSCESW